MDDTVDMFIGIQSSDVKQDRDAGRQIPFLTDSNILVAGKKRAKGMQIHPVANRVCLKPSHFGHQCRNRLCRCDDSCELLREPASIYPENGFYIGFAEVWE